MVCTQESIFLDNLAILIHENIAFFLLKETEALSNEVGKMINYADGGPFKEMKFTITEKVPKE
jgi:hypothetical protein